ncbi:uncharacterized protein LOC122024839 [Zingiber officinale]|uniref:uncharacterized protein LOC122024839 n=1 Tax=Zingiber officinale TaxID=94328 RepID=UPI001C4D34CF|nr:uncharacterized protein LOC122024839 [Zingiber officinale]
MADKAAVGVADDMGESMQCVDHPYRSNPGGVCAICLQEKLGKLVSSSKSTPFLPLQPSPSSSTSSRTSLSDVGAGSGGAAGLASVYSRHGAIVDDGRRTKFPYLSADYSKKKKGSGGGGGSYANGARKLVSNGTGHATASAVMANGGGLVLKRSKSVATRTSGSSLAQVGVGRGNGDAAIADSPRKKSFWSFLYHSSVSSTSNSSSSAANGNSNRRRSTSSSSGGGCEGEVNKQLQPPSNKLEAATARQSGENGGVEDAESPSGSQASSSFGRKVSRSRSVGCGSRSFSGDFLERISTGFGDCTLRRVESQREAKPKTALQLDHNKSNDDDPQHMLKERIKCGGFFPGFGMMSAYWLSPAPHDDDYDTGSRVSASTPASKASVAPHVRTRTWSFAFASPMRAFRPYSSSSRSLYTNAGTSTVPATNFISSINASNKIINGHGGGGNQSKLGGETSFLAVQS